MNPGTAVTVHGLDGSVWARREEATRALLFLAQVEALATAVQSMAPDGQAMAKATDDARAEAVHAVLLWRTAVLERTRAVERAA